MSRAVLERGPIRSLVNALLAVVMLFGVSAAIAPAAHATAQVECWTPTANGEGRATMKVGVYLTDGPYQTGCGTWGWVPAGSTVYFHCWTINSYGNVWWYVRLAGTDLYGWTSDANVQGTSVDENGDGQITFYQC
jgi:hypothetical protein